MLTTQDLYIQIAKKRKLFGYIQKLNIYQNFFNLIVVL